MKDGLMIVIEESDNYDENQILSLIPTTIDLVLKNNKVLKNNFGVTGSMISENTMCFIREMFENHLEDVADDPWMISNDGDEVKKYLIELESYSKELNIEMWKYLDKNTSTYEFSRLNSIRVFGKDTVVN